MGDRDQRLQSTPFGQRTTLVIGGFLRNTPKVHIERALADLSAAYSITPEMWCPDKLGSVGHMCFKEAADAWKFIKAYNQLGAQRFQYKDVDYGSTHTRWVTIEKSKAERLTSKKISKVAAFLADHLHGNTKAPELAQKTLSEVRKALNVDYRAGRVAHKRTDLGQLDIRSGKVSFELDECEKLGITKEEANAQASALSELE